MSLKVKTYPGYGRGVYTTKAIRKGKRVLKSETLLLPYEDVLTTKELCNYVFSYDEQSDCLVLGIGSLFNHSKKPNCKATQYMKNGRLIMYYKSIKKIKKGEQLFIDYGYDPNEYEE